MKKNINGADFPLAEIFSSKFEYHIPSYQRPYAWTVDETSELFDDLYDFYISEPDDEYFLGSIVLIKEDNNPKSDVIDGQQRLTTLTILLAALASRADGNRRDTLKKYILEPGNEIEELEPKPRLTLRDRDRDFFEKYVQRLDFDSLFALEPKTLTNESQRNLQFNSRVLIERIDSKFSQSESEFDQKDFEKFLIKRCYLVSVSTPNQQSAFRIFSVMNSRGLDLQPTDIIKAEVIGKIENQDSIGEYNDRWEDMEVDLGRGGFNDLFAYIRMIYAKEKAKRELLTEFKTHVLNDISSPESFISDILEPYAVALSTVKNINYQATTNAAKVNDYLRWLNKIDNSDWIPPAIRFLSQQRHNSDYVLWFFKKLERLAAYMHVCAKNVNERITRYAEVIEEMEEENSYNSPLTKIELTDIEKVSMQEALDSQVYKLTARRRNYIILRLDSFMSDGAASYEPSKLTIEHVLPQTVDSKSAWETIWPDIEEREEWIHRIANLVPLNLQRNIQAQNYDFEKKKTIYFSGGKGVSSYALTTQVLKTSEWTKEIVKKRQKCLLQVMINNWELE